MLETSIPLPLLFLRTKFFLTKYYYMFQAVNSIGVASNLASVGMELLKDAKLNDTKEE